MAGGGGSGGAAIVGLGITDVGKVYGRSVTDFAVDAVQRALADCGLDPSDVDGIITSYGMSGAFGNVPASLGLRNLGLNVNMFAAGATASAAIQYAATAVTTGMARNVVYVHGDAPLQDPSVPSGSSYATGQRLTGIRTVAQAVGLTSPNSFYALAARRHMNTFGTTSEQLGAIAVGQRAWAAGNPIARFRAPMTHRRSPEFARDRRSAAPPRLLHGLERGDRLRADIGGPGEGPAPATCPRTRLGAGASDLFHDPWL